MNERVCKVVNDQCVGIEVFDEVNLDDWIGVEGVIYKRHEHRDNIRN